MVWSYSSRETDTYSSCITWSLSTCRTNDLVVDDLGSEDSCDDSCITPLFLSPAFLRNIGAMLKRSSSLLVIWDESYVEARQVNLEISSLFTPTYSCLVVFPMVNFTIHLDIYWNLWSGDGRHSGRRSLEDTVISFAATQCRGYRHQFCKQMVQV